MPIAPLRADESERLRVLRELDILDTDPEERFDRLSRLAILATGVPASLVSLVDQHRQWFKSRVGVDACETSRADSFCGYVVHDRRPLVIGDATSDPRTSDMSIVVTGPRIRAYAGYPLFNPQGHCLGSLCIIDYEPREFSERDLDVLCNLAALAEAELNNAERNSVIVELATANEAAERATQAQLRLTATIGHEIRTALNGIVGVSELLNSGVPIDDTADVLQTSSSSLMTLINDLLDYTKFAEDGLRVNPSPTQIRKVLSSAIDTTRPILKRGVQIKSDCAASIPEWVNCDSHRLRQVLLNLLGNAAKFTQAGHIQLSVEPTSATVGELKFSVMDTGEGVTDEEAARIFEPFAQANAGVAQRVGGTGLGLTISRKLVEKMGGTITFESQKNVGSTFAFILPAPATAAPAEEAQPATPEPPGRSLQLLAAEDDKTNRRLLGAMLKKIGHSVEFVESGHAAVEKAAGDTQWDAILMDVGLPDLDGLAATRAIRENEKNFERSPVRIIAITADANTGSRRECERSGMTAFLPKPITLAALRQILR
ncbi:MAG: ATP-binding protein [Chthoniobacterales bacterium]